MSTLINQEAQTHKVGQFSISAECMRNDNLIDLAGALFVHMVVLKAEYRADTDAYDYIALSEWFEDNPVYCEAPWYTFTFVQEQGKRPQITSVTKLTGIEAPRAGRPVGARIRRLIEQE